MNSCNIRKYRLPQTGVFINSKELFKEGNFKTVVKARKQVSHWLEVALQIFQRLTLETLEKGVQYVQITN